MIRFRALVLAAGFSAFIATVAQAALPTENYKFLPLDLAIEAAQGAIAQCKSQGYNVTVTIVDRLGATKLVLVGDGAGGVSREVTMRKAYTSAKQRVSTDDFTKRVTTPGAFNPGLYDSMLATGPGGLPIKVGDATIGGIAAAGAPGGDKDEACAKAGLDKIKDRLN
jgi:uncharacterized protein GlcG (DUF336 family)